MLTADVKIQFKDAPKEGKKNWKIKSTDGKYYSLSPELASQVQIGDEVSLVYEESEFKGFKTNMVKTLSHMSIHGTEAPAAPVKQAWTQHPFTAPRNGNGHSQEFRTPRQMFVSDVLSGAASGGDVSEEGVRKLTAVLCSVWDEFLV